MALNTVREGNVVSALAATEKLPKMVKVKQLFDRSYYTPEEIPALVHKELDREEMRARIKPGMSIAITCGSRGVANIAIITKAIVDFVKECGGVPFVFPSMGSHGGATPEGQVAILTGYGVTEEFIGCPIKASMEVVHIGDTPNGMPVYVDKYAYEADGIILCGRVKAHTLSHVLHSQFQFVLNAVDALMLRTVIHKHSLNIFHLRDQQDIYKKDHKTKNAFQHRDHPGRCDETSEKACNEIRKQHKDRNRHTNGQCNRSSHKELLFLLCLKLLLLGLRLLLFFLLVKAGGISQCLHAHDHRIYKIEHSSYKGSLR